MKLKPCKECKQNNAIIKYSHYAKGFYIQCNYCDNHTPTFKHDLKSKFITMEDTKNCVRNYWNKYNTK